MEEAVPVVLPQGVDEEAAEEVVSISPTEAATEGVEPPSKKKRTVAPKKRDALPGVRRRAVKPHSEPHTTTNRGQCRFLFATWKIVTFTRTGEPPTAPRCPRDRIKCSVASQ